jgi:hypothetical protein
MSAATVARECYGSISLPSRGEWPALVHKAALNVADDEGGLTPWQVLFDLAWPKLCVHRLYRACLEHAEAVRVQEDLASDADLWAHYYPSLEGPGQRDAGRQIAEDDVGDTLNVLLYGRYR